MKNRLTHRRALSVLLVAMLLPSCMKEGTERQGFHIREKALSISPSITGRTDSYLTRAVSDTDPNIAAGDAVAARSELREDFLESLDVFVKESGASDGSPWFKSYHLLASDPAAVLDPDKYEGESLLDSAKQWLADNWSAEGFVPGTPYDIYVTGNNPATAAGAAPASLTELKGLATYEYNIFRYYKDAPVAADNSHMQEKKKFLMDGKIEGWQIDAGSVDQVFAVDMKRAAAKIVVNLKYSDSKTIAMVSEDGQQVIVGGVLKDREEGDVPDMGSIKEYLAFVGREPSLPKWKYINFGFRTADIADGTYQVDMNAAGDGSGQEGLQTYSGYFQAEKRAEDAGQPNINSNYQVVTYSYPTDWSANAIMAPCLLMSVTHTLTADPNDKKVNYYRIPVCDERAVHSLDRNHIYVVDVDIASLGSSSSPIEPEDAELRLEYHVIPWAAADLWSTSDIKVRDTKYLMVTPINYILRGNDNQSVDLQWYASVAKDDGRIVDIDVNSVQINYYNYLGTKQDIKGTSSKTTAPDGTITITCTAPTDVANGEPVTIRILPTGFIRVTSKALDSRAVKNISFTVQLNTTSLSETVTLRHFPLDNIQNIEGWWSSKVSTAESGGTVRTSSANGKKLEFSDVQPSGGGWTRYTVNGVYRWYRQVDATVDQVTTRWILYDQTSDQRNQIITSGIFTAKVVHFDHGSGDNTKRIRQIGNPPNNSTQPGYGTAYSNLTNNQMYVLQTTATSDQYTLGRPVLDANYQSLDDCVSPAFMIASQLGAVNATNSALTAARHCGTYMEVGVDGTHYQGWRLPTGAELGAIIDYQRNPLTNGRTIVEVLGGAYYWALDGRAYDKNDGNHWISYGSNYVRCVRDLTLDEIEKLNNPAGL
ncbi:MAG: DUF1566 domain-containing protein [Bacteroidales bacterium]|nr:hypothetical protein [Bacteroidota bacterium]NLN98892.1 DUF1566 domain-containing protein [Bacteroidales bacterium]